MKRLSFILFLLCTLLVLSLTACMDSGVANGTPGPQGEKGEKGEDGLTPYIGEDGNWWIGDTDTGVNASGIKGDKGDKGDIGAQGPQGEDGDPGIDGEDGRTAEYRSNDGWVQWKYTDEDEDAWRNLYEYLPTVTDPSDPIPDGVASAYITTTARDEFGLAGTYTMLHNKEVAVGDTVSLIATVNDGYNFDGWYITSDDYYYSLLSQDLEYDYIMPNYDVSIEAIYSYYTVSTQSYSDDNGAAGTYTMLANKKVSIGDTVTLTATVNEGYNFEGWFIDNKLVSNSLTYSFEMTDSNKIVEARYSAYTVNTSSVNNVANVAGTYTNLYNKKVEVGDTVALVATVNPGYNFEGWYIDDVCVSNELNYSYVMERSDVEIIAVFSGYKVNTIGISYNASWEADGAFDAGTYTTMSNKNVSAGESVTLTATVNEGYNFVGWFINDTCVETSLEYTFTMGKADVEIEARYVYYRLTTTAKHVWYGGSVNDVRSHDEFDTPELYISIAQWDVKAVPGTTVTVTATEIEGYTFCGWRIWDSFLSHDMTYTFTMPANDHCVYAIYQEN